MTDEHLEFYADRYVRHGIKDCGVTLIQYLADPARYAPLESLLPRQRIAAGKAMAEMSMPARLVPPVRRAVEWERVMWSNRSRE